MKSVTTKFSNDFVAAVIELGRIFGDKADFGAIVEKHVGGMLEDIAHDADMLIDAVEARAWDDQLEAASVGERVLKKVGKRWHYWVQKSESVPGSWDVRFVPVVS